MALNKSKGNMYEWITHTWNTVKGECPHKCTYCYMHRWGKLNPVRFDQKELKTDLGQGNFIFVGSSCDMWADDISEEWILDTLSHCSEFDNTYLFQTKNPQRVEEFIHHLPLRSKICTTIETNRFYFGVMGHSPNPWNRTQWLNEIAHHKIETYVTIEPIMEFDVDLMSHFIETCLPTQVNIGADSGGHNLPEPSKEKIQELIAKLETFTKVVKKKNLNRILKK